MNHVLQHSDARPLASAGSGGNGHPGDTKGHRSDGVEARNRLLDAALVLFAEKGFAKPSTREIALAAQVNIASISYYFGDKAGLYRAVFIDPRCNPGSDFTLFDQPHMGLAQALRAMLIGFTEPLKQGHLIQACMKLHFREMLEPTEADDDIHRLAFSVAGLGMMLQIGSDVFAAIRPNLIASPEAIDQYADRLIDYALAMVAAETGRRQQIESAKK